MGTAAISYRVVVPRPVVGQLSLSPNAFKAAASGPSTQSASRRSKRGTVVSYTLDQSATVRFTIEGQLPGRKAGRGKHLRCIAPTKDNQNAPRCTRTVTLHASFTVIGKAGANTFRFTGRLAGRTLLLGGYTLIATPTAAGLSGNPAAVAFRIVK